MTGRRRPRHSSFLPALAALSFLGLALLGWSGVASAQFGGQPGGGMGPGMGPQPDEPKEEGPAEAAPDDEKEGPSEASPLGGYPGQQRKMTRIVTFDGYLRLRTDFFHKLNLGQGYVTDPGLTPPVGAPDALRPPPFPLPLECPRMEMPCEFNNFGSGNTRFRLEPTINVTDQVRVHSQIDILDNTIMGSTPDSMVLVTDPAARTGRAPLGALSTTQDPPEIGRNGYMSSIRAKRAWAEVDTEFGSLKFGRMPWHFGRGMTYNNGACMDCEGGTTVDRVLGQISVYGHKVTLSWDWGASGYHMGMTDLGRRDLEGFPLDLSQEDDVFQLMGSIALLDDEQRFRERVEMGELAVNYGLQLVYRQQNNEVFDAAMSGTPGAMAPSLMDGGTLTRDRLAASIIKGVDALIFQPSVWFKLGWKALTIELEGSAVLGTIENAGPLVQDNNPNKKLTLQQIGWVLATELRLYRNAFFLGFETGGATGDQAEDPFSHLNYRWRSVRQPAGDTRITDFKFNPDYQVDQILFRRILGTVSNALYFKPLITYWLDLVESRQIGLQAAGVYSVAPVQVSTPGNSLSYGIELDLGLHYRNPADGFFAGLTYSVLWPMGALDRGIGSGSGTGTFTETQDAETSQVLRFFLGVRF